MSVAALILAAGAASRFGGPKVTALLDGRPLLEHVLAAARAAGLDAIFVVLGAHADEIEAAVAWGNARRVRNPAPELGLASSLQVGLGALGPGVDAALVLLGDQPLVRPDVIRALVAAAGERAESADQARPIVAPRYADGSGPNPALLLRGAWPLAAELRGDRGMGPVIAARPELVRWIQAPGDNPDVDTPADLAALERADRAP
jgi:molybdenum cofactor cytidylyltransferase